MTLTDHPQCQCARPLSPDPGVHVCECGWSWTTTVSRDLDRRWTGTKEGEKTLLVFQQKGDEEIR